MNDRGDLTESVYRAERAIDHLFAPLPAQIGEIVMQHAEDGAITPMARIRILEDVDQLLAKVYPSGSGRPSPLEDLIASWANAARMKPMAAAVTIIRTALKQDRPLLRAMGDR